MKVIIGKPKKLNFINQFVIRTKWMYGDADGNQTIIKSFSLEEEEEFLAFAKFWLKIAKINHFDGPEDFYLKIAGYALKDNILKELVKEWESSGENDKYIYAEIFNIPNDPITDYQLPAIFQSLDLSFYDENGIEYHVTVE